MKFIGAIVLSLVVATTAFAQAPKQEQKAAAKQKQKAAAPQKAAAKPSAIAASYEALPLAERLSIQNDLVWTGHYNGVVNGEFGDRAVAAVKAFQARNGTNQTGVLNPQERAALATASKPKQETVGWRIVDDPATGVRLGIPGKIVPQASPIAGGWRWASTRGEVQVETFRITQPGTTLATVFEQQRKVTGRKIEYNVLRPDFFVMSGLQNLKKFYVRGQVKDDQVRGVTILYDQAMDGIMEPVVIAMSNAFTAFPTVTNAATVPPPRRKVEYATGIVVSANGDIVTDREAIEGCYVVTIPGLGGADRIAEDKASGLVLLRVFGARDLKPIALAPDGAKPTEISLIGVADPQAQAGNGIATTLRVRLNGTAVEPAPALGFSGGAALDGQGRLVGMAISRAAVLAGPTPVATQASMVPVEAIRALLTAEGVTPAAATPGMEAVKSSVVRVICARK